MTANNESLANRFVELLADRAECYGQRVSRWAALTPAWRCALTDTISAFLAELGCGLIVSGDIDERGEDEQVRELCEHMTTRQRLKTYRQLYALGCRMNGIEQAIEKLTKSRS